MVLSTNGESWITPSENRCLELRLNSENLVVETSTCPEHFSDCPREDFSTEYASVSVMILFWLFSMDHCRNASFDIKSAKRLWVVY